MPGDLDLRRESEVEVLRCFWSDVPRDLELLRESEVQASWLFGGLPRRLDTRMGVWGGSAVVFWRGILRLQSCDGRLRWKNRNVI